MSTLRAVTAAERRRLIDDGTIGDSAFQQVEREIDFIELDLTELAYGGRRPGRPPR